MLSFAVLCYPMLYYAMLCMLWYAMVCHAKVRYVISCYFLLLHVASALLCYEHAQRKCHKQFQTPGFRYATMGLKDFKFRRDADFLPGRSRRSGEQTEKLPESPIFCSEMLPEVNNFCPAEGSCSPLSHLLLRICI